MFFLQSRSTHKSFEVTYSNAIIYDLKLLRQLHSLILPFQHQTNSYLKQLTFINVESQQTTYLLHALHTSSLDGTRHSTIYNYLW